MSNERAWDATELRRLLRRVPVSQVGYGPWWGTDPGRELAAAVVRRLARPVVRTLRSRTGRGADAAAVLGLVVEAFAPPSQLLRGLLAPTTADPIAYLVRSLANALARELGADRPVGALQDRPVGAHQDDHPAPRRVRLEAAIRAVTRGLAPLTPRRLRRALADVVERVVDRATDGALSRLHTRTAADRELLDLGWSADQLRALVNAVVGARPDHGRASLIAGFLADERWRPRESLAHRTALRSYERRMARAEARTRDRDADAG